MAGEIFISYRRSDEPRARLLYNCLRERGVEAWYDAHVGAGEDWRAATAKALERATIFVLLYSKAASESDDITKELAAATFSKKQIVPVRLENIPPSGPFLYELAARNWVDAFARPEADLASLADKLAAMAKGLPQPERQATPSKAGGRPALLKPPVLIGASVAIAVVIATAVLLARPAAGPPSQRIAFFDVAAAAGDVAGASAATTANEEIAAAMAALRLDALARQEPLSAPEQRFAQAATRGAGYVLSGDARGLSTDTVSITVRIDDVTERTTLWQQKFDTDPVSAATQAAARATDTLRCLVEVRQQVKREDRELLRLIADVCGANRLRFADQLPSLRQLVKRAPESIFAQATLAGTIARNLRFVAADEQPPLVAEAREAIAAGFKLDPTSPTVHAPRIALDRNTGTPLAELEAYSFKAVIEGKNHPDTYGHSNLSQQHGNLLAYAGRNRDAMTYIQGAVGADPLGTGKRLSLAERTFMGGQMAMGETQFDLAMAREPQEAPWGAWVAMSLFSGSPRAEERIASPPGFVPAGMAGCWQSILRDWKAGAAARAVALRTAKACSERGDLTPATTVTALAGLGDVDGAFAAIADPRYPRFDIFSTSMLFSPAIRPLREDDRFIQLMKDWTVWDAWVAAGTTPDVCRSETERDGRLCSALRAAIAAK